MYTFKSWIMAEEKSKAWKRAMVIAFEGPVLSERKSRIWKLTFEPVEEEQTHQ